MTVESAEAARGVWFYREFQGLTGGQVKHADYFEHVRRLSGFLPRLTLGGAPLEAGLERDRQRLWPVSAADLAMQWQPQAKDVLFLAGTDWRYLRSAGLEDGANPRINLIQHVRHAKPGTELYGYLNQRAIRICVSIEVAAAIGATGRTNGPVFTIPNGIDLASRPTRRASCIGKPRSLVVVGYKRRELATVLCKALSEANISHVALTSFLPRRDFLQLLAAADVAVCLPHAEEGFYLPALEAMASGCVVVTLDCVGNRSFCRQDENCLLAEPNVPALLRRAKDAMGMDVEAREKMLRAASGTVAEHTLEAERRRFLAILEDVDWLWASVPQVSAAVAADKPLVDFMIVGAQKCGTTALAHFLAQHPEIGMAHPKESHLFDAPEYSDDWTRERIDERYRPCFAHCPSARLRGEATPIYMHLAGIAAQLKRYNPHLKLIVMLRDPVERALSEYRMACAKGMERRSFGMALLLEPFRLWRDKAAWLPRSAYRRQAYRRRGLYSRQLRNLYRHFDASSVLVVRAEALRSRHDAVLREVFAFLGARPAVRVPPQIVNAGAGRFDSGRRPLEQRLCRWLLRMTYVFESRRLKAVLRTSGAPLVEGACKRTAAPSLNYRTEVGANAEWV